MTKKDITNRLDRLEQLKARLKVGDEITIAQIAAEMGVSGRTISRDISVLREQGLPIDADKGRGGGVRLNRHWGVGRVNLNFTEALDLMVGLAVVEQQKLPIFMTNLTGVKRKILASFTPDLRFGVADIKARILVAGGASSNMLDSYNVPNEDIVAQIHQAFLQQKRIKIKYTDVEDVPTVRQIEPQYLLLCAPIWYILAWDELRQDVRSFRIDRIFEIVPLNQRFVMRDKSEFTTALMGLDVI